MSHRPHIRARRRKVHAAVLALLLGMTGCSSVSRIPNPFGRSGQQESRTLRIKVENRNFADVRIFAKTVQGERVLGVVTGNSVKDFSIPWTRLDEIYLSMQFLAGRRYRTNTVNATPGDRLELVIEQNPRNAVLRRR